MKKQLFFWLLFLPIITKSLAQNTPSDGHQFKWVQDNLKVYQSIGGQPGPVAHYWNFEYWFYTEDGIFKDAANVEYVKIFIPKHKYEKDIDVSDYTTAWSANNVKYIDLSSDGEKYLLVKKIDYDKYVKDHYPKRTYGLVLSALTVPFKIHPAIGKTATSLYNSNFNAGMFVGCRIGFLNDVLGASAGGMFGISSLNQSSAENTAIANGNNATLTAANYGLGLVIDLGRKIQLGAIAGWDYGFGDLSTTYTYQKKTWYALSLNFAFLDLSKKDNTQ